MINLLCEHFERHPLCEVVDIYKLLYQAANGPRHLLSAGIDATQLTQQWSDAIDSGESPLEPISADGLLVRAHFAPLKYQNIAFDDVWSAFILTAETFLPNPEVMVAWWRELEKLIRMRKLPLPKEQYTKLEDEFQKWGFEPKHHSIAFSEAYKPAYIVVMKRYIESRLTIFGEE